ncbi:endosome-associated-trafficking regulator 1 [Poecilia reticulata]|uniref:endosome-associated-trafficking regulator 1 n=1 Tax=Poecilia reticulata TaxID=8081 RepID=UPI0004A44141|nr:PREDICTED: serologically defined colon cancer antigen 3 [Poecilia reticulata]
MSGQRGGKSLIITDDEEEEVQDGLNPFSFKEFLRWKNQDQNQNQDQDQNQNQTHRKEDALGRSFQPLVDSGSSLCTNEEEEDADEDDGGEETRFSSNPEGGDETPLSQSDASRGRSLIQQMREENSALRRSVRELQRRAELHQSRARRLSEELQQRRRQEEQEAQDLESMVQSVEQNLQLMKRRAVKAESSVSRLKAELQQLQVEVDTLRSENNRLKAAESEVVMTMRQNAQVAAEYLSKSVSHAHSSVRQLLEEAETLRLVSQLLQSIDKISSAQPEGAVAMETVESAP